MLLVCVFVCLCDGVLCCCLCGCLYVRLSGCLCVCLCVWLLAGVFVCLCGWCVVVLVCCAGGLWCCWFAVVLVV